MSEVWPARYSLTALPSITRHAPAKKRNRSTLTAISSIAAWTGLPAFWLSRRPNSSARDSRASAIFSSIRLRSCGVVCRHVSNADAAAFAARSTSSLPDAGVCATTSPVAGFSTSSVSPDAASTNSPPMNCWYVFTRSSVSVTWWPSHAPLDSTAGLLAASSCRRIVRPACRSLQSGAARATGPVCKACATRACATNRHPTAGGRLTGRVSDGVRLLAGRYEMLGPIGAGGMAVVWRARDVRLGRVVAVKILREPFESDPELVRRFDDEARNAASLSHPNIVAIYDTGVNGSDHYIVMELVDGPSLADLLAEHGRLEPDDAASVAAAAARGLAAAHRRGIVHRDIKPGNLLLGRDGRLRVVDFGIARALTTTHVTVAGTILGSVPYLSPEQARGEEATAASDIFSLGIVLFEMLTGRLPWNAANPAAAAIARLTSDAPPVSEVDPSLPPGLDPIVSRALARKQEDRHPSARQLAQILEAWRRRWSAVQGGIAVPAVAAAATLGPAAATFGPAAGALSSAALNGPTSVPGSGRDAAGR